MKKDYTNRLLVAVDGSDRSIQTIQYLADISSFRTHSVIIFHVFNKVPESYYDITKAPASLQSTSSVRAWEVQQRKQMEKHMSQCRQLLLRGGFHPDRIKTIIHNRRVGIARDIGNEAYNGYDTLVLGRRGMGQLHGLVMGSVAFKLLNGIGNLSLIFAGRRSFNHRVLVAVDESDNAMRAVAFAGEKLAGSNCSIRLLNVLRGDLMLNKMSAEKLEVQETFDHAERQISESMFKARNRLVASGFVSQAVTVEIVKDAPSRTAAIVKAAVEGNYNTIVTGRKGISQVREFTIGRVSSRILQVGREFSVWIVQ